MGKVDRLNKANAVTCNISLFRLNPIEVDSDSSGKLFFIYNRALMRTRVVTLKTKLKSSRTHENPLRYCGPLNCQLEKRVIKSDSTPMKEHPLWFKILAL